MLRVETLPLPGQGQYRARRTIVRHVNRPNRPDEPVDELVVPGDTHSDPECPGGETDRCDEMKVRPLQRVFLQLYIRSCYE